MNRELAIKEIEDYLDKINFTTTAKSAKYPSVETLEFCLALLKEENLLRKEDLMVLIRNTNFCGRPHWRKEEMLDEITLNKLDRIAHLAKEELIPHPIYGPMGELIGAEYVLEFRCPRCGNLVGIDDVIDNYCSNCGTKIEGVEK